MESRTQAHDEDRIAQFLNAPAIANLTQGTIFCDTLADGVELTLTLPQRAWFVEDWDGNTLVVSKAGYTG